MKMRGPVDYIDACAVVVRSSYEKDAIQQWVVAKEIPRPALCCKSIHVYHDWVRIDVGHKAVTYPISRLFEYTEGINNGDI